MYDYRKSKEAVEEILKSQTDIVEKDTVPASDAEFTYSNGIKTWVGALFVDIVGSSELCNSANENTARIFRSFCSEVISILKDDANYREIGIRGDCVYGIFTTPYQEDLVEIFRHAYRVNTFMRMFNRLLKNQGYTSIHAGIGLGCGKDLIIKAGQSGSGINDKIWIGKAVVDACHLGDIANRNGVNEIAMSTLFYENVIGILEKENGNYKIWIQPQRIYNQTEYYHCSIIETGFNEWIEGGMV